MDIKSIKASSELMNIILDQLNTGVYIIDEDNRLVPFNSHYSEILGNAYSTNDVNFCQQFSDCENDENRALFNSENNLYCVNCNLMKAIRRALEEQVTTRNEIIVREDINNSDNIRKYYRYSCKPLTLEGKRVAILMVDDITKIEEKRAMLYEQNLLIKKYNQHYQNDIALAKDVQNSIIPKKAVNYGDYNIDFIYFPLEEIGGDMFDIIPIDEIKVGIFVCDVIGHGLPAALVTTMIKALLANNRRNLASPADLMNNLNYELIHMLDNPYMTAFYGVLDVRFNTFKFVRAGHPFPWLIDDRHIQTFGKSQNPMIGIDDQIAYQVEEIALKNKDKVLIYTDGLLGDEEDTNYENKLLSFVDSHEDISGQELLEMMGRDIKNTINSNSRTDDVCALIIEKLG